ncbi:MAG TPA: hypothetical protein VHD36_06355 [Pirellulales bacterium]|nr:hypothetical protein [Pirellulales bacterium]
MSEKHCDAEADSPEWPACKDGHFVMLLAGGAAVKKFAPKAAHDGGSCDVVEARKLIHSRYGAEAVEAQLRRLLARARAFVAVWQGPMDRVARDLADDGILSSEDLQSQCESMLREPWRNEVGRVAKGSESDE